MGIELDFNDFSNGYINSTDPENQTWEGTGVFDELMKAINGNIQVQYDSGRIKGGEYATVYLGSMQAAISEAMKFMLTKDQIAKDLELKDKDLEVKTQQILSTQNDDSIKLAQSTKDLEVKDKDLELKYVQQIKLDKEAAAMGLDSVVKSMNKNTTPGYIYTPQYKRI